MTSRNSELSEITLAVLLIRFTLLTGLFAGLVSGGCGGGISPDPVDKPVAAAPATVSDAVNVGTSPRAIAVDPSANKIYVADFGKDQALPTRIGGCGNTGGGITVIDGATDLTMSVPFGLSSWANPFAIATNPATHIAYLFSWEKFSINGVDCTPFRSLLTTISGTTFSAATIATVFLVPGLRSPLAIDVNPQTSKLYVANACCNNVTVIDVSAIAVTATVPVGTTPTRLAVDATTNKIYVANSGSNDISVIDGATNSVIALADPGGTAPDAVAVNPATNTIYVANGASNNVSVIDGFTDSLTATVTVGTSPVAVAVDSQRNVIYVANAGSSQTGDPGNVTIIDGATNHTTTLMDPKAAHPAAVAVNSVTNKIYVANSGSNNVTAIDGAH